MTNPAHPLWRWWIEVNARFGSLFLAFCMIASTSACIGVYVTVKTNSAQDALARRAAAARTMDNTRNALVGCQNANESRAATLALWNFLFDVTGKNAAKQTPEQKAQLRAIRVWIGKLYQPHDCQDLARKYPIPPPPVIGGART